MSRPTQDFPDPLSVQGLVSGKLMKSLGHHPTANPASSFHRDSHVDILRPDRPEPFSLGTPQHRASPLTRNAGFTGPKNRLENGSSTELNLRWSKECV